jgi:hypothetical protein
MKAISQNIIEKIMKFYKNQFYKNTYAHSLDNKKKPQKSVK